MLTFADLPAPVRRRNVRSVRGADVAGKRVLVHAAGGPDSASTLELLRDGGARSVSVLADSGRDPEVPADGYDLFVEDAFGSVHRANPSLAALARALPAYAGLALERELDHLGRLLGEVEKPFVVVVGGARSDAKLGLLTDLGGRASTVLAGGRLAEHLRVVDGLPFAVELPADVVGAERFGADAERRECPVDELPYGWLALDIGPRTRKRFADCLRRARTIFWHGPMGADELPSFGAGTQAVAEAVAAADAYTVVAGGDTLHALDRLGLRDRVSWASTGGEAALALLQGSELPGLQAIAAR